MKYGLVVLLVFIGISFASAQDVYTSSGKTNYKKVKKHKGYDPDKLVVGGYLNASLGSGFINAGATPIVGYRLTKHFIAGVGLGYQYFRFPAYYDQGTDKYFYANQHSVYPNVWMRYFVWKNIFLDATYEHHFINLTEPKFDYITNQWGKEKFSATNPCLLIGGGFKQPIGGRVSIFASIRYDVLRGQYSPYPRNGLDFRIGVAAGM